MPFPHPLIQENASSRSSWFRSGSLGNLANLGVNMGKSTKWTMAGGIYCTFNAFRHEDVYVEFHIPGGVGAYTLDEDHSR